jgi:hypothetical protein
LELARERALALNKVSAQPGESVSLPQHNFGAPCFIRKAMTASSTYPPMDIGLILTYKCQSACKHCLYNCGPAWVDWMNPDDIQVALQIINSFENRTQIHITGGEPFLNFPLLLKTVEMAAELGIPRYVETNAGWCINPRLVADRFMALRDAGLHAILISCSPFHAETIPLTRTLLAIDRALSVFGPNRVLIYIPEWIDQIRRFGTQTPTPLERFVEAYGLNPAGLMFWDGYGLISGGRAGFKLGQFIERKPVSAFRNENCRQEILTVSHFHLDLYGNFIPNFCGGLSAGDWHNLPDVLNEFSQENFPPLIKILIESGPFGLYKFAQHNYQFTPLKDGYSGKCHLCAHIRLHLSQVDQFPELKPLMFYNSF